MSIEGGYILQPRAIDESQIMKHPPIDRELWFYLIRRVNHINIGQYKRGSGFFSYTDIQKDLEWFSGYRRCEYSKPQISKAIQRLCNEGMIKTSKSARGTIVTICKYDYYQSPDSYKNTPKNTPHGSNDGRATEATMEETTEETVGVLESDRKSDSYDTPKDNGSNDGGNDGRSTEETTRGEPMNKNVKNVKNNSYKPEFATRPPVSSFGKSADYFIDIFNRTKGTPEKPTRFKMNKKLCAALDNRIKEGYTSKDFIKAIENCKKDKYHIDSGLTYLTPEFILRPDKLERFLNMGDGGTEKKKYVGGI